MYTKTNVEIQCKQQFDVTKDIGEFSLILDENIRNQQPFLVTDW